MTAQTKSQDISPMAALAILGLVVGAFVYFKAPTTVSSLLAELDRYGDAHMGFLAMLLVSVCLNCMWAYSLAVGEMNRQGKRLEILTGKKSKKKKSTSAEACIVGSVAGFLSYISLNYFGLLPNFLGEAVSRNLNIFASLNFAISSAILANLFPGMKALKRLLRREDPLLPPMPVPENGIVLGSVDEETEEPKWVVVASNALYGNILITGSIGIGKTQGMILPFLYQIITNFKPFPSILAIDPKGTFIREAKALLAKFGLSEKVLVMELDGPVSFNPIYLESPLKKGRFLEIAQMIRAAAVNFEGNSGKQSSSFWEIESYNLIKNGLAYCAAVLGYFTLNDLYDVLTTAGDAKIVTSLKDALKKKEFDAEERFNVECALKYFENEYHQLEPELRTGILATATSFLNQFQEFRASKVFCPKENERTIKSMNDIVDQGLILLFNVTSPALARSMGTFVKLHYQQSLLSRLSDGRSTDRAGLLLIDEYQDVVSVGSAGTIGDDAFLAKAREAKAVTIVASQSLTSLKNAVGKESSAEELFQNFRTRLAGHSSDLLTIRQFQELVGQEEVSRKSHSVSEMSHRPTRNIVLGGFDAADANISEGVTTTEQKEYSVTGREFSRLNNFECFAQLYDGVSTVFKKLFLKPFYLENKRLPHSKVLETLKPISACVIAALLIGKASYGFPNVCTVAAADEFNSCLNFQVGACVCGFPPHPCAQISYYVPETFIEVLPDAKDSYFNDLPGTAIQLAGVTPKPYGAVYDDDTQSFHARTIAVPLATIPFNILPCGTNKMERTCFDGMSEHLGSQWDTGSGDSLQPNFLAWGLSPKACLLKGAAMSVTGEVGSAPMPGSPTCSTPLNPPKYPPSSHSACTGWGVFYPRSGTYNGPSSTAGALMVASRIKSLSSEVFMSTPGNTDEQWQMIFPQSSSCFREGQNVGLLETVKNAREVGRLKGKLKGYLFVVWGKTGCCQETAEVPVALAEIEAMVGACKAGGAL